MNIMKMHVGVYIYVCMYMSIAIHLHNIRFTFIWPVLFVHIHPRKLLWPGGRDPGMPGRGVCFDKLRKILGSLERGSFKVELRAIQGLH